VNQVSAGHSRGVQLAVLVAGAPLLTASYVGACAITTHARPSRPVLALVAGTAVFVPAAFLSILYVLPAVVWLAFFGFVVPVAAIEGLSARRLVSRSVELARADVVHAIGGIATFVLVFALTRGVLILLLRNQSDIADRAAVFLADVVISPLLYLGSALLFADQRARLRD
jgi:hypothetical protein